MNKPLLLSLAAATILTSSLSAQSMYERIQDMELQMKQMQSELTTLKATKSEAPQKVQITATEEEDAVDEDAAENLDSEEESVVISQDDVEKNAVDEDEEDAVDEDSEDDEEDAVDEDSEDDDSEDDEDDEDSIEDQIADMQESITDLNKATNGNHLKFQVDYRFAVDNMQYKMADDSEQSNDGFLTNRLWINMKWKATDNLSFSGQLAYNKAYGARSGWNSNYPGMETFDWITNENAHDGIVRVRSAYFLYKNDTFMSADIPWTFSIGRRPSTNGHLVNLREDDGPASPMGHSINVEFDGLSSKFAFEDLIGIDGMYIKFCAGRGGTNATPKFFAVNPLTGQVNASGAPYATNDNDIPNIDLGGLIFVPYDDGQYGIATQYYYANNLIDANIIQDPSVNGGMPTMGGMQNVGGMHSFTANFTMNGIGDEWSDYLDDTFFFVSGAVSITNPKADKGMLGSAPGESKTGYSAWAGLQMPSFMTEDGRWGLEYNNGSQYWRSITYGEDTNIGSKLAARGDAYEAYFTEPLIEDILSLQVRYTYIDYKYTGSNGFFGNDTGSAIAISDIQKGAAAGDPMMAGMAAMTVDKAQDIRFYLRYRY